MKKLFFAVAAVACMAVTSCTTCAPVAATSNPVGKKCGEAVSTLFLGGLFGGTKDAAINEAAKKGGITRISHVDTWEVNYANLMILKGVRVYGE
jgi:hypothetical protein